MEVLWNKISLQRPPFRPWNISIKKFDARKFMETLQKILDDFHVFETLHAEAALLSRLIYRMKSKFRSDNGLKQMAKVNRALLNYLNMSIEREFELLKEYTEISNGFASLPSRQILEYTLVRSQGFAKLMYRVELTAKIAANILKLRLHTGQAWSVTMIAYAVISRIWILSRNILKKVCTWYSNIYSFLESFKVVGVPWLPYNYVLPKNLLEWLNLHLNNEDIEKLSLKEDWNKSIFNLIKANNTVEDIGVINDLTNVSSQEKTKKHLTENNESIFKADDLGELISREDFAKETKNSNIKEKNKIIKLIGKDKINKKFKLFNNRSEKDLVYLLKADSIPGFNKLQLKKLQKRIKKLLMKLTKNNTCDVTDKDFQIINRYIKKWIN